MAYQRLTVRTTDGKIYCLLEYDKDDLIERLADLEDKIEKGELTEQKHAHWDYDPKDGVYTCSACDNCETSNGLHCSLCGALMDENEVHIK